MSSELVALRPTVSALSDQGELHAHEDECVRESAPAPAIRRLASQSRFMIMR
jgi:hypothetical protein